MRSRSRCQRCSTRRCWVKRTVPITHRAAATTTRRTPSRPAASSTRGGEPPWRARQQWCTSDTTRCAGPCPGTSTSMIEAIRLSDVLATSANHGGACVATSEALSRRPAARPPPGRSRQCLGSVLRVSCHRRPRSCSARRSMADSSSDIPRAKCRSTPAGSPVDSSRSRNASAAASSRACDGR